MKTCPECGAEFVRPKAKYCGPTCSKAAYLRQQREYQRRRRANDPEYREKQRKYNERSYRKRGYDTKAQFHSLRVGAAKRDYVFEITFEDFTGLISNICYYCNRGEYVGVDRIDNSIGYVLDNCRPCCKHCNHAKRDMTEDQFYDLIRRIYETRCKTVR